MKLWGVYRWDLFRTSFWFTPALKALASLTLGIALPRDELPLPAADLGGAAVVDRAGITSTKERSNVGS